MTVTALAERYRDLGFRVIEGGKSNKLVVVNSIELAENFRKDHFNVLRDIRSLRKRIETDPTASDLKASLPSDFRKTTYVDAKKERRECYELTETGFEALALGYDAILRYRYAIAFRQLKEQLGLEAQSIVRPVIDRMQELRGHQPELDLTPTAKTEQTADDEDADDANARHLWKHHEPARDNANALPVFKRNAWIEQEDDAICMVTQRDYPDGAAMMMRFVSDAAPTSTRLSVFEPNGKRLLICVDHIVPLTLVLRCYARLGRGPMSQITLNTLREFLAR